MRFIAKATLAALISMSSSHAAQHSTKPIEARVHTVAQDDKYCANPEDRSVEAMCALSRKYSVPVLKVVMAQFFAGVGAAAIQCRFSLTKRFVDGRAKALADPEVKTIYEMLFESAKATPPRDLSDFCVTAYKKAGPSMPEQSRMFR